MQNVVKIFFDLLKFEYIRYLIIGVFSNLISFVIFYCLARSGLDIAVSSAVGMVFGILNTYTLGRKYIKNRALSHSNLQLIIFALYYAVAVFLTSASIAALTPIMKGNENISWLFCTIVASLCNYLFISKITLSQKEA